ncbi:hypothetical protein FDP41_006248 [Naegleria fowleri]|uniref:Vacuolar protein 8 n=1 Tax=Naegleria fowleri TaxID=5763 RepID=A0A6A5BL47_NAEFO|nr:uncharacterized protein FDP41_006248 [Naegleria fowleri]KAF0974774.1 hypothetical protein FDP41_006248 [Naegleria fowleri]CAG4713292.1 unnamed protein product [Naegleria fowleri]
MASSPFKTFDSPSRSKTLSELTFKFDKNQIINPNPDVAHKSESELVLEKVPELIQNLLYGKTKDKIHASCNLRKMSDEKVLRKPLAMTNNFVESICAVVMTEQESDGQKRCQQHALAILGNLLLEDPLLDTFIANEENCLPGLSKMLCSDDKETLELASRVLDYISVTFQNQSLVCTTDGLLYSIVQCLKTSQKNLKVKQHVIQALVYLSANPKNRFVLARESGLLEEINGILETHHRMDEQHNLPRMAMQVIYNLCLLKENIPLIAKHGIRNTIKKKNHVVKDSIQSTKNGERQYPGYQNDILIWKLSSVVLDVIGLYDKRFDSQSVLNNTGFNSSVIEIGAFKSRSIVMLDEDEEIRSLKNQSTAASNNETQSDAFDRRRRAAARRNKTTENVLDEGDQFSP